jgi:hypothetical protein
MNSKSLLVKNLYKQTLKIANELGYRYGSLNRNTSKYWVGGDQVITRKKFVKMYNKNKLGLFLAANMNFQYKVGKEEKDEKMIDELIDSGFSGIKMLNYVKAYTQENEEEVQRKKSRYNIYL